MWKKTQKRGKKGRNNGFISFTFTTTDESFMVSMSMGMACSTRGLSWVGSGPSRIEPNDINAASLK